MTNRPPILDKITGLRQRRRADGSWRVWWEPNHSARNLGFEAIELNADRATWSVREAKRMNDDVDRKRRGDTSPPRSAGGRTVSALIHDYRKSVAFTEMTISTKRSYNINLNAIDLKWGEHNVGDFTKPIMRTWYESLYKGSGPAQAQALIRMFSILMSHAEVRGWRQENANPCFKLKMKSVRKRHRSATWAEYDALMNAAKELGFNAMACAIALATLQAQRQTDLITATIDSFRNVQLPDSDRPVLVWELIRSKRDNYGVMPIHPEAQPYLKMQLADASEDQIRLLVDEATGAPYSGDLFRKRWAAIRARAAKTTPAITSLQFRDLRRTFGVWARAGGGSREDVGDVLGNSAAMDPQLGETYMPPSYHTAARAVASIQRPTEQSRKKA